MEPKEIDYTEGALDIPRGVLASTFADQAGPQSQANVIFTPQHLSELTMDVDCYALQEHHARAMVEEVVPARVYIPNVFDCDNRAFSACADLAEFAASHGWEKGMSRGVIGYHRKETGGYHAALFVITFDRKKGAAKLWVVELPYLRDDGSTQSAKWSRPEDEVRDWVWRVAPL